MMKAMKVVLTGKLIALSAFPKKLEQSYTNNLTESSRTKRSKHTKEEQTAENNQTEG